MSFLNTILTLADKVLTHCRGKGWLLATAESCTGGLITSALTEISGSSDVVDRGFITYSNEAKMAMLDVPASTLEKHGAVSEETCNAMVQGALLHSGADIAIAVTGVAGPTGGTVEKPVGLVHISCATKSGLLRHERCHFTGNREGIRLATVEKSLEMLLEAVAT